MKLRVLSKEDNSLEIAFGGEGHTLLNLLQSLLLKQKGVKMAGYSKPHPLMDRSVLFVSTEEDKPPEVALIEAAEEGKRLLKEFLEEFEGRLAR
ncbi:MAG: DNA-directed RNA polymerase subunit L [Candidatus Bathyarchaeia archaeon]|nr:DNA-directed RNA polymerase subunit L [Candidatus Bathyarchaeota archaeon]